MRLLLLLSTASGECRQQSGSQGGSRRGGLDVVGHELLHLHAVLLRLLLQGGLRLLDLLQLRRLRMLLVLKLLLLLLLLGLAAGQ